MRFIVIGIVLGLIILGAVAKYLSVWRLDKRKQYTIDYREKFISYCNEAVSTGNINNINYHFLMKDVNKIQRELGTDGIVAVYRDPVAGFQMNNYPMF